MWSRLGNGVVVTFGSLLDHVTPLPSWLITGSWLPVVPCVPPAAEVLTNVVVLVSRFRTQTLSPTGTNPAVRSFPLEVNTTIGAWAAIIGALAPPATPSPFTSTLTSVVV